SRSRRRVSLCRPTASRPAAASMSHFEPRANRLLKGWNCKAIRRSAPSERDDDLAEHLPALKPRKAALEVGERDLSVDDRPHAPPLVATTLASFAGWRAEGADDAILLLEQLHQVERGRGARGRAAGDQPPAAPETQQRAIERLCADVLEYDVDSLLGGELTHR